ncbi:MAG: hypothetical protein R3264_18500, partial [Anaerolineae bacterium]|nr:hypothetical protein [Anaerolineae bacterium]
SITRSQSSEMGPPRQRDEQRTTVDEQEVRLSSVNRRLSLFASEHVFILLCRSRVLVIPQIPGGEAYFTMTMKFG